MDFRYRTYDVVPPSPPFIRTTQRFSYASLPPSTRYHDRYLPPPFDAPPPDHGYFYSRPYRASMLDYVPWGEESTTRYYSFLPYRPRKDPFLEREYERERIREEILREEVRRRIIEEEVRWELEMERRYNIRHSYQGYHGIWPTVPFEQPRFSHGCLTRGPRGKKPSKRSRAKRWVKEVQHKIVEIDEEELMSKTLARGDKVEPSNKEEIQKKKKDEQTVQTEANANTAEINVSEIAHKKTKVYYEEIRRPRTLIKDKVQYPKNQEVLRSTASLPKEALTSDKIKPINNTIGIDKEGDGKVLKPASRNKVIQSASSKAPLPEEVWPKDKMKPLPNRNNIEKEGDGNTVLKPDSGDKVKQSGSFKASLPEDTLPNYQMKLLPNRNNILKEGDGNTVLKPDSGNKVEQPASSKAPLLERALPKGKMKLLPNRNDIEKKGNGKRVLKPDSGNKVKQPASSNASLPEDTLPKDKMKPLSSINGVEKKGDENKVLKPETYVNKVEQLAFSQSSKTHVFLHIPTLAALGSHPPYPPSNGPAHQKGQQTHVLLQMPSLPALGSLPPSPPLSGLVYQKGQQVLKVAQTCGSKRKSDSISALPTPVATSRNSDKELLKVAKTCGSKRKNDFISSLPTPAATSSSSGKVGPKNVKMQKVDKKEYSCTFCRITVSNESTWLGHLNGKKHQRNLKKNIANVEMSKKVSSDVDNRSTSGIVLPAVKMVNGDSLVSTKPTEEEFQVDKGTIRKMQVGREVHEVVEKNNRLWCERCRYNCTTTVMMTIHLVSEKHKNNCQKQ